MSEAPGGVARYRRLGGPLLEKREKWRTPSYFASTLKDKPALYVFVKVAHPPEDAVVLDSTKMSEDEVLSRIEELVEQRLAPTD
jgi:hypothetical protein